MEQLVDVRRNVGSLLPHRQVNALASVLVVVFDLSLYLLTKLECANKGGVRELLAPRLYGVNYASEVSAVDGESVFHFGLEKNTKSEYRELIQISMH